MQHVFRLQRPLYTAKLLPGVATVFTKAARSYGLGFAQGHRMANMEESTKMTSQERAVYGRMGDNMEYFHSGFRQTYKTMYEACEKGRRPANMSIRQFLSMAEEFCHHLTLHHTIEEQHIFPLLATRMPAFRKELELLTQHKQIHVGLDRLEEYLEQVKKANRDFRLDEIKIILDSFGTVLWSHLDDEVRQLSAENMKKYWSMEEVRRLPM